MDPLDHTNTFVLLIGASHFPDQSINSIPNVLANIKFLKESLLDPNLIGIPEANVKISLNEDKGEILKKLKNVADETKRRNHTLLVYYSGHGILSSEDYSFYLTTAETSTNDLEIEGININEFRKYIKRSIAGRKIVILDCCHSGSIIEHMSDMASKIQSGLNDFEGTYVMTSAASDEPSLFPKKTPELPTYFTSKFLEIVKEGLDVEQEYCSFGEIFKKIKVDFNEANLPRPQQSNFNNADQLYFSKNRKFLDRIPADELAWKEALKRNTKWAYINFKEYFPESHFSNQAIKKIYELEEEEKWKNVLNRSTFYALYDYLNNYPSGKYVDEAHQKMKDLRKKEEEEGFWNDVLVKNNIESYQRYLNIYPDGKFANEAKNKINYIPPVPGTKKPRNYKKLLIGGGFILAIILSIAFLHPFLQKFLVRGSTEEIIEPNLLEDPIDTLNVEESPSSSSINIPVDTISPSAELKDPFIIIRTGNLYDLQDIYGNKYDYAGDILENRPNGYGVAKYSNGDSYNGNYLNGLMSGHGTYTFANRAKYIGEWKDDKRNGKGTYTLANGDIYVGEYKDDKRNGEGTFTWADGDKYVGEWKDGVKNGEGTYTWADGDNYDGGWKDGDMNGFGTFYKGDGVSDINNCPGCKVYSGNWLSDKKNGLGICYDATGKVLYSGEFQNDKPVDKYPNSEDIEYHKIE